MSDLEEIAELNNDWDEFLRCWPPARLETMTLLEYTEVQNPDTFTYSSKIRISHLDRA